MIGQKEKEKILEKLDSKKIKAKCPMCGKRHFAMADSYIRNDLQDNLKSVNIGGPSIPSVVIICTNCGFLSQHALGMLGLLSEEAENGD